MKTPLLLIALAASAIAADPVEVKTARPARGEIIRSVSLPGVVRPLQQATLYAKTAGYLQSIAVDKGDTVAADAPLAIIESPELTAELAKAEAELVRANAHHHLAELDFKRLDATSKKTTDLVTPMQVDKAKGELDVSAAEEKVAATTAARIRTLIAYTKITAPFAGVVTARFVDPGAFIPAATANSTAASAAIVTLMDFSTARLQVAVPEIEASLVAKGQPVSATIEGLPSEKFTGQVTRFSYALDEVTKTMLVEAEIPNPKLLLRPGMYATVKVGVEKHANALLVPVEALVMEKQNAFVFTLADGKAKKNAVKLGFNDGKNVEIASGIAEDATVILAGTQPLTPDQPVKPASAK